MTRKTEAVQSNDVVVQEREKRLTAIEFQQLAVVPAAVEWFTNIDNPRTRRAYQNDLTDSLPL